MSETYFETLASAVDAALAEATEKRVQLFLAGDARAYLEHSHLPYGQVRTGDFRIDLYKGKPTKKYFHVVITRLDSGRYELVTYIL